MWGWMQVVHVPWLRVAKFNYVCNHSSDVEKGYCAERFCFVVKKKVSHYHITVIPSGIKKKITALGAQSCMMTRNVTGKSALNLF